MQHFVKKCKYCQTILAQCRCPAPDKIVEWGTCKSCEPSSQPVEKLTVTGNCDWCGKQKELRQLDNTHYWVCLNCAISRF